MSSLETPQIRTAEPVSVPKPGLFLRMRMRRNYRWWGDHELNSMIVAAYYAPSIEGSYKDDRLAVVFHQHRKLLPRRTVRNTIKHHGEFSAFMTFRLEEPPYPSHEIGTRAGWTSHDSPQDAVASALDWVGPEGWKVHPNEPRVQYFKQTIRSLIAEPWEWEQ